MNDGPADHVCLDCEVAWRHHEPVTACWNCGQPRSRGALAGLFHAALGRRHPGFDHQNVVTT